MSHDPSVDPCVLCWFIDDIEPIEISHIIAWNLNEKKICLCAVQKAQVDYSMFVFRNP